MTNPGRALRCIVAVLSIGLLPVTSAGAETETLDFVRKEVQQRGPEDFVWGGLARDRGDLRRLWDRYDQNGPMPRIRFGKNVAVVAGTGGSSSCPARLHDLRLNRAKKRVVVRMYQEEPDGYCTDDWVVRTWTVAVARADLKPLRARELKVRPRRIEDPSS